ncbi:hypothetical protein [Mesoterricola silvestris]|uniref:Uncharacterized protein n=1 Tax=Mesoterricola silvestris TaxID=2927979 RepID=A0AA48GNT4_9BACT|nr:hypothetical protein [Mesoterricola silvestris]BDU72940.1 hypothetical protein METEAL_21140 [Mesoterricola silvestris]
MREYGIISPAYWKGQTGRQIRAMGPMAQLVGCYLMTAPTSNLIGLYYLPLVLVAGETNTTVEEVTQIMQALAAIDWAYYDQDTETVWVRNMAFYQVAERVERADNRWAAIYRELTDYDKSPFFSRFLEVYGEPFNLTTAFDSPSGAPPKGLSRTTRKIRQAPPKPLGSTSGAPTKGSDGATTQPEQAPLEPLRSPSQAKSIEHRAEAKNKEQEQGASASAPDAPAPAPEPRDAAAATFIPGFLERSLGELGISGRPYEQLVRDLGAKGLQCAIYKIRNKQGGRNPVGLLLKRGADLAEEGRALLQESLKAAQKGAPEAFKDPRWVKMPPELRDDPEAMLAWAAWIPIETAMFDAQGGSGEDEARARERDARKAALQVLKEHHPDPEGLDRQVQGAMASLPSSMPAQSAQLMALTKVLGLGGKP